MDVCFTRLEYVLYSALYNISTLATPSCCFCTECILYLCQRNYIYNIIIVNEPDRTLTIVLEIECLLYDHARTIDCVYTH